MAALLVVVAIAGCGGQPASSRSASSAPAGTASTSAYDPPRRFASTPISVGGSPAEVAGGVAYAYTDTAVVATDLATGSRRWSVPLPGAANLVSGVDVVPAPAPAVVTDSRGHEVIVAAYLVEVAGTGTQQDSEQIQVLGITTGGVVRWRHTVQAQPQQALQPAQIVGQVHDARGAAVVLYTGGDTLVLDSDSGAVRWDVSQVDPADVDGDTVLGVSAGADETTATLLALRGADGSQLWSRTVNPGSPGAITLPAAAGPGRAVVVDTTTAPQLIDTATGAPVAALGAAAGFNTLASCVFDDQASVVCSETGSYDSNGQPPVAVAGFDAHTGQQLWIVTNHDPTRTTFTVLCAFHGALYATSEHGPVVLDARTGTDLVTDPGIAPTQVVRGYGLVTSPVGRTHQTAVYPATQ